jgi:hypothetical protein
MRTIIFILQPNPASANRALWQGVLESFTTKFDPTMVLGKIKGEKSYGC